MSQHLKWLPTIVAKFADDVMKGAPLPGQRERLHRVTSDPAMEKVWRRLERLCKDPWGLREYARKAVMEFNQYSEASAALPTPGKERSILRRIERDLDHLLEDLGKFAGDPTKPVAGVSRVLGALHWVTPAAAVGPRGMEQQRVMQLWQRHLGPFGGSNLTQVLTDLRQAVQLALASPAPRGPRKRYARSAPRTEYVQMLVAHTQSVCGRPLYAEVATTVNVALAEYEHPLSPSHVRKLIPQTRKIPKPKPQ